MNPPGANPAGVSGQPQHVVQGKSTDRTRLAVIARRSMVERGLEPDFSPEAKRELAAIHEPAKGTQELRDLRNLLWASIDNDDSRDLDQLTVAESLPGDRVRILVAVADVDALVRKGSALDGHAARNTTSVYTPAAIFPMLPEELSTNLTSLNEDQDRIAAVADMIFEADGSPASSDIYRARVRNRAKLAYNSVAAWLDGTGSAPHRIRKHPAWMPISVSRTASRSACSYCATTAVRSASRRSSRAPSSRATLFRISIWTGRTAQSS